MKLTRERKIYLLILGLGVGALLLDRGFAGAAAQGADTTAAPASAAEEFALPQGPKGISPGVANLSTASAGVVETLRSFSQSHPLDMATIKDVFQPPTVWTGRSHQAAEPSPSVPSLIERFQERYRLTGTIVADRQSQAIINGRLLSVGQILDGFRLVAVTQHLAIFESGGDQVVLRVPQNPGLAAVDVTP